MLTFQEALKAKFPDCAINIADKEYIRVQWVRPEEANAKTQHRNEMLALCKEHGAVWDGWDEEGYPCFVINSH